MKDNTQPEESEPTVEVGVLTDGKGVIASGIIATVEDALAKPADYEVAANDLGFTLRHVDSQFSTMVTPMEASRLFAVYHQRLFKKYLVWKDEQGKKEGGGQ